MDHDGTLLTVGQTAAALERSTEQVRRYLREGRLPGQRLGGQWFIRQSDLTRFHEAAQARVDEAARGRAGFLSHLGPARTIRPLDAVIGIIDLPGTDISQGKREFLRAAVRRRG